MNSEFNLLHHVGVVANRVRVAAETAATHEGDDNTPSGSTGRGVKTVIMAMETVCIYRLQGLDVSQSLKAFFLSSYTPKDTLSLNSST